MAQHGNDTSVPETIMQRNASATKVKNSLSTATFALVSKDGAQRVRKVLGYTRLASNGSDNMRLVRFVSPADIKGTATLLLEHAETEDDIWIYLPALGKTRRLSAANKKSAYVGTDFSYGDIVGYKVAEWQHRLVREEELGGVPCYVIESVPANETVMESSGYSKRVSWIAKSNFMALRVDMWDTSLQPLKTIVNSDIQLAGEPGKWQAMTSEATNLQSGHKTRIRFDEFKANQNVPESLFTVKELER
jgi:outer membrane lipoprotein-sorting protein